jgi:Tol biopolymer transport system component
MKKHFLTHITILAGMLLSSCSGGGPTAAPAAAVLPTQDMTVVAVAAEATVRAMAREATLTPAPTFTPAETATAVPTPGPALSDDFWIVHMFNHRLTTTNSDGSTSVLLTNTPAFDYLPSWSPDGQSLAFLRIHGRNNQDGMLMVLPPDSNSPRALDEANLYGHFTWLPDSNALLAVRGFSGQYEVFLVDARSGAPVLVSRNVAEIPKLSPDGKTVAVLINTGMPCDEMGCKTPNDLFMFDVVSRQTTRLTQDAKPKINLSWSPDSQQIAYFLWDGGDRVDIVEPDGQPVSSQQPAPWWTLPWQRSPDGSQIVFVQPDLATEAVNFFLVPSSGGDPVRTASLEKDPENGMYMMDTLRWRPDGSGFIFNVWNKLYTVNLDGSGLRALPVELENVLFDVRPSAVEYSPPPAPSMPESYAICPGALDTRLDVGRQAMVSTDQALPNNVRDQPTKEGRKIGMINQGYKMESLGGPFCAEEMVWWEVRTFDDKLRGYTVEGDTQDYWLEPLP